MIQFLKKYGALLNIQYRPCLFHESCGGGVTDEDLESGEGPEFLTTDCITTKEVLIRLFNAKTAVSFSYFNRDMIDNIQHLTETFKKYSFCTVHVYDNILADAHHHMTLINIDSNTYLIQSYLDRYSYDIKEYNYIDFFIDICIMFSETNTDIAEKIMGKVQSYKMTDQQIMIKFKFHTYTIDKSITIEKAKNLVNNI